MAIKVVDKILEYSDEEIIAFLYSVMVSNHKNFKTSIEAKQPELLWASYGDIEMVTQVLKAMKQRNDLRKVPEA